LQITPDHWEKAAGGNIPATHSASGEIKTLKNPRNLAPDGDGFLGIWNLAPPVGLEPTTNGLTVLL
jgi:hypothetical protein